MNEFFGEYAELIMSIVGGILGLLLFFGVFFGDSSLVAPLLHTILRGWL